MSARFAPGTIILYREVDPRVPQLIDVKPVTVVEDTDDAIVLWLPRGTPTRRPVPTVPIDPGAPRTWREGEWELRASSWEVADSLVHLRPGQRWATWLMWTPSGSFAQWAVNLQSDLTRHARGFDLRDHQLDILVTPDRRWRYKDQHELDAAVDLGRFTADEAADIRHVAATAVAEIEAGHEPFTSKAARWTPDPAWPRPHLLDTWDDLSMYGG